jgi:hypothetical protein
MKNYLEAINSYLGEKAPEFFEFYAFFQAQYFSDENAERNSELKEDEIELLDSVNDEMSLAGQNPTEEERKDGIIDQYQFRDRLLILKQKNISIWKRYNM